MDQRVRLRESLRAEADTQENMVERDATKFMVAMDEEGEGFSLLQPSEGFTFAAGLSVGEAKACLKHLRCNTVSLSTGRRDVSPAEAVNNGEGPKLPQKYLERLALYKTRKCSQLKKDVSVMPGGGKVLLDDSVSVTGVTPGTQEVDIMKALVHCTEAVNGQREIIGQYFKYKEDKRRAKLGEEEKLLKERQRQREARDKEVMLRRSKSMGLSVALAADRVESILSRGGVNCSYYK